RHDNRDHTPPLARLKALRGPSDDGSPCIIVMMPEEDSKRPGIRGRKILGILELGRRVAPSVTALTPRKTCHFGSRIPGRLERKTDGAAGQGGGPLPTCRLAAPAG